jgi:hypothetical protein
MTLTVVPSGVRHDLRRLVESEALGAALFEAAAGHARTAERKRSWIALRDLEIQTKAAVARFIERSGLEVVATHRIAEIAGTTAGTGLVLLPYRHQLRAVRTGTARYLPAFRRLAEHYHRTQEAPFFDYVVRHELAIIEFTTNAIAVAGSALDPVNRLLDEGPPRTP